MAISKDPSIVPISEEEAEVQDVFHLCPLPSDCCFLCFEPVDHPAIYWRGHDGQIWLHPQCVLEFTAKLQADVRELLTWYMVRNAALH
jgi:hypothetical protein